MDYHQQGRELRQIARAAIAHAREAVAHAKLLQAETHSQLQEAKIAQEHLRALRHPRLSAGDGDHRTQKEE
jgi:hypothetical protein